jgi:hypothetical protein
LPGVLGARHLHLGAGREPPETAGDHHFRRRETASDHRLAIVLLAYRNGPLGYAMVGGLALSQLLTLYTTPVAYLYLDRLQVWLRKGRRVEQPVVAERLHPVAAE